VWSRDSSVGILNRLQAGPAGTPIHWVPVPSIGAEATRASWRRSFAPPLPSSVDFKNEWEPCSQPPLWNCLYTGLPTLDGLIAIFHVNLWNSPTIPVVEDKHAGTNHDTFLSGGLTVLEMIIVYCLHDPLYSFNIQNLEILPVYYIYGFLKITGINSDCFCEEDAMFSLFVSNWIQHYLACMDFSFQKVVWANSWRWMPCILVTIVFLSFGSWSLIREEGEVASRD
jgi:hypothetical protein